MADNDWFDVAKAVGDIYSGSQANKAGKQSAQNSQDMINFLKSQGAQTRADAIPLFQAAQDSRRGGYQGAMDIFGQTYPQQVGLYQQGNVGAQRVLGQGSQQYENAILGRPVNRSFMEPQQFDVDTSFSQQQLPEAPTYNQILGLGQQASTGGAGGAGTGGANPALGNQVTAGGGGYPATNTFDPMTSGGQSQAGSTGGFIDNIIDTGKDMLGNSLTDGALQTVGMVSDILTGKMDPTNTSPADIGQLVGDLSQIPGAGSLLNAFLSAVGLGDVEPEPNRPDSNVDHPYGVGGTPYTAHGSSNPGSGVRSSGMTNSGFRDYSGGWGGGGNTGVVTIGGDYQGIRAGK